MSTDLDTQFRTLGMMLDGSTRPVTAAEAMARATNEPVPTPAHTVDVVPIDQAVADDQPNDSRRWVLSAVASVLVLGLAATFVLLDRNQPDDAPVATRPAESTPADDSAATPLTQPDVPGESVSPNELPRLDAKVVPVDNSLPRSDLFPALPADDPRNDSAFGSYTQIGSENSRRVTGLVAVMNGTRLTSGLQIQTVSDRAEDMFPGTAREVLVSGQLVEVFEEQGTPVIITVVLPGDPTITVTGLDPLGFLEEADGQFASAAWIDGDGTLDLDVDRLPDGYEVIVEPRSSGQPGSLIASLSYTDSGTGAGGALVEVTLENRLPSMAAAGDIERVEVNGTPAWVNTSNPGFAATWQISETAWALLGGVRTADAAVEVAEQVEFVDEAAWRDRYGVSEPQFGGDAGQIIAIDRGRDHGLMVGMPVVNAAGLVGKVTAVTDTQSEVLLLPDPRYQVTAQVESGSDGSAAIPSACSIAGRNDHVELSCEDGFGPEVHPGAIVATAGGESTAPAGIPIGTIESIQTGPAGDQTAIVTPLASEPPVGTVTVIRYQR